METSSLTKHTTERLNRERQTFQAMVGIYCHKKHRTAPGCLCADCTDLLGYAFQRIEKCPFKENKPTCRKCPVHCYKKDRREEIRRVMAYAGPWMLIFHPVLTLRHYLDEAAASRSGRIRPSIPDGGTKG